MNENKSKLSRIKTHTGMEGKEKIDKRYEKYKEKERNDKLKKEDGDRKKD